MSDAQKLLPPADTVVITRTTREGGGFRAQIGERHSDGLTSDEALFVVAAWIIAPDKKPPYLRTKAEQEACERQLVKFTKETPIVTE